MSERDGAWIDGGYRDDVTTIYTEGGDRAVAPRYTGGMGGGVEGGGTIIVRWGDDTDD